jgi:hypothetical protein
MECAGMRVSTSQNQANGSTRFRLQEAMKLRSTAAVLPPLSLPKKEEGPVAAADGDVPIRPFRGAVTSAFPNTP